MKKIKGNDYRSIKERLNKRAMGLWGIDDRDKVDPVIDMLLDVFAYEIACLNDEVKISDGMLLERLARILVDEKWSLPAPSHALLKMVPTEGELWLDRKTQFYYSKMEQGESKDIFFTPIARQKLIKAYVRCVAQGKELIVRDEQAVKEFSMSAMKDKRIEDHAVWVGIKVDKKLLKDQKKLPICFLLKNSDFDSQLRALEVQDIKGNVLPIQSVVDNLEGLPQEHYFDMVNRYYQNYLYEIDLENAKTKQKDVENQFPEIFDPVDLEDFEEELFWLKINLPVSFDREEISKLEVSLNVFPIVNRKYVYKQHSLARNGRLVSLPTDLEEHDFFLNLEGLMDDKGEEYSSVLKSDINDMTGTYSLYFGNTDRFDQRNAKGMLEKMIQTVREEGSAFSAIGYDLLNAHLEDLSIKLDLLEKKVNTSYKNIIGNLEKQYLITEPHETASSYECEYWKTNANAANGIEELTEFNQYQSVEVQSYTIMLQTETVGGIIRTSTKEKINSLRSGVVARERIVSKEDIKAFVKAMIGSTLENIEVKSGITISEKKKEGLVRTSHVVIELSSKNTLNVENKKRMAHFIKSELEHRSVQSIPYQVQIC